MYIYIYFFYFEIYIHRSFAARSDNILFRGIRFMSRVLAIFIDTPRIPSERFHFDRLLYLARDSHSADFWSDFCYLSNGQVFPRGFGNFRIYRTIDLISCRLFGMQFRFVRREPKFPAKLAVARMEILIARRQIG